MRTVQFSTQFVANNMSSIQGGDGLGTSRSGAEPFDYKMIVDSAKRIGN
jgi:hypothetical protein